MSRHPATRGPSGPERVPDGPGPGEPRIRRARRRDLTQVALIESRAFTSPWSRRTFYALVDRPGVGIWVAEDPEGAIVGYAVLWCILDEGELANIAVREERRGQGIGSRLLERVMADARERGLRRVHLEVRASNDRAIGLYLRRGFQEVGRRRDYYDSPPEDALILTKTLNEPTER